MLMVPVLGEDYLVYAEAKGLKPVARILTRYALRNCYLPQITALRRSRSASSSTATILVEQLFNYPGLGTTAGHRDPAARLQHRPQGDHLMAIFSVLTANLILDLLLPLLDPRVQVLEVMAMVLRSPADDLGPAAELAGRSGDPRGAGAGRRSSARDLGPIGGGQIRSSWRRTSAGWCPEPGHPLGTDQLRPRLLAMAADRASRPRSRSAAIAGMISTVVGVVIALRGRLQGRLDRQHPAHLHRHPAGHPDAAAADRRCRRSAKIVSCSQIGVMICDLRLAVRGPRRSAPRCSACAAARTSIWRA